MVINGLEEKGIIGRYAIGGGIAAVYYIEPVLTYDLDIFFIPADKDERLAVLSPIYDYLGKKNYRADKEHIIIEGIPVQFIPVYNELIKEAVETAGEYKYQNTYTKIILPEYLMAIMLQTFRAKDRERILRFIEEAEIDKERLADVLQRHGMEEKYKQFREKYYEKPD